MSDPTCPETKLTENTSECIHPLGCNLGRYDDIQRATYHIDRIDSQNCPAHFNTCTNLLAGKQYVQFGQCMEDHRKSCG